MPRGILILILASFLAGTTSCVETTKTATQIPAAKSDSNFTIDQLEPKILPYVFTDNGTWIVEPVQISEKDKRKAMEKLQNTMRKISSRLKPFPSHRDGESIIPKIKMTPITIVKQGRSFKTLGWYDREYNAIVLTWDIVQVGEEGLQYAFSHELGHWVWCCVLTEQDKKEYRKLILNNNNERYEKQLKDPGIDHELLVEEWFAEDFRVYACGIPDYSYLLYTSSERSPGKPDSLVEFFARFRNEDADDRAFGERGLFPESSCTVVAG